MATKNRKHSGRKRPTGELKKLNLRKFEKMIALAGDRGLDVIPHIDPRYYPTIVPHKPIQAILASKKKVREASGES
jgi:hypothetical protein